MKTNALSNNLKRLLFEHNLKVMDLARLTEVPQPTLQRLVAGATSRPHEKSLLPIANYFGLTVAQLTGESELPVTAGEEAFLEELGIRRIPLLSWHEVSAWLNSDGLSYENRDTIVTDTPVSHLSYALRIHDASMAPVFPIGTIVIFDAQKEAKDRYFVLVKIESFEEPIFRQLLIDAKDRFIKPISPDLEHFRVHFLDENDHVLGVLVEAKSVYS